MQEKWKGFTRAAEKEMKQPVDTTVSKAVLKNVTAAISKLPEDKIFI